MENEMEQAKMNSYLYSNRLIIIILAVLLVGYYFRKDRKKMIIASVITIVALYVLIEWYASGQASKLLDLKFLYKQRMTEASSNPEFIDNGAPAGVEIIPSYRNPYYPGNIIPMRKSDLVASEEEQFMAMAGSQEGNVLYSSGTIQGDTQAYMASEIPQGPVPAGIPYKAIQKSSFSLY